MQCISRIIFLCKRWIHDRSSISTRICRTVIILLRDDIVKVLALPTVTCADTHYVRGERIFTSLRTKRLHWNLSDKIQAYYIARRATLRARKNIKRARFSRICVRVTVESHRVLLHNGHGTQHNTWIERTRVRVNYHEAVKSSLSRINGRAHARTSLDCTHS